MPSRHPDLHDLQNSGHHHSNGCGAQPLLWIGKTKSEPDQYEGQSMLADLAEVGMRAVANVTRTASSQAIGRSKVVMSAE